MKKMRKILTFLSIMATLVLFVACGNSKPAEGEQKKDGGEKQVAQSADVKKNIAVVYSTGGKGDKSFNDATFRGLERAQKELGISFKEYEPKDPSTEAKNALTQFAETGEFDLIIAVGYTMKDSLVAVAKAFPDQKFAIIDETVKLDKKFGEGFVEEDGDGKRATESKDEWEKLYQKDKRNYVALERLIESYFLTEISNDSQKKKYVSEYLKMDIPEDRKNFVLGRDFWNYSENKEIKNEYFEKVKKISDNQYYLKTIDFFEYILKETENIKENGNPKLMKQKIDEITQKMDEIDKILDNKNLLEKYRISDEEAYSAQLTFFMVGGILKAVTGDTEEMVNDFIKKIANKQISKEVAEYNQNKEIIIDLLIKVVLAFKEFSGEVPKERKNFEKLMKRLQETEMYKRITENSENDEGNANFESTEDKESNIYHEEKKKYDK